MSTRPQWQSRLQIFERWINPPWRREREPFPRAVAWASTFAAVAVYLGAFVSLGPGAGGALTALYAIPCVIAGWAFGFTGGFFIALLTAPLHGWLFTAGYLEPGSSGYDAVFAFLSAVAVGVSVGAARELRENVRERSGELEASEDRYRQLVDNSPEGVIVHERGVIVFANPSMARLVGVVDARELVGRTLVALAPFEDREALQHAFVQGDSRRPRAVEARVARGEGPHVEVVMTTIPIPYRGNRASLVLVREQALVRPPAPLPVARVHA